MKYLVIISQAHADGTDVPAMTAYDDYNKAVSAFHMELAYSAYEVTVVQGAAKPAEASTDTSAATGAGTSADTTTTTDTTTTAASTATNQGA